MKDSRIAVFRAPPARYAMAVVVVVASFLLRFTMVRFLGAELPPFLFLYPSVMLVAVLGGLGPGLVATALAVVGTDYLVLAPVHHFAIIRASDALSLTVFAAMGVLMSLLAERHQRSLLSIAAYKEEQALWMNQEKLDVAMASMTDAVFISDAKGQFLQFNDAFATFHKFADKTTCARALTEYPEFLEVSMADGQLAPLEMWAVPRALRGETAANEEYRLRRKDTGETWIGSYTFGPIRDPGGAIIGSVVVGRDITEQKRAQEALRKSETLYHGLFDSMDEGFCIIEVLFDSGNRPIDFRLLEVNASYEKQTGIPNPLGKTMREIAPDLEQYWFEIYGKVALTGEPAHVVNEAKAINGYYDVRAYRVGEPEQRRVAVVFSEISERMRSEAHIRQLIRVYAVLSDINQTIVREKDPQAMLEAACRIAVDKGHFRMAWIGMADPATGVLEPVASSGVIDDYLHRVRIDLRDPKTGTGPAARCFHTGEHAFCNDIEHELYRPWMSYALELGYRSLASFPLRCEGQVVGVFNIYANELAFFDQEETKLLDELAMDISFALEVARNEKNRRRAEQHVRKLNRVYAVLSGINEIIVREKDSQAMLEAACRIAVEKGRFVMAWIGMTNPATLQVDPIASSGDVDGYLNQIRIDFHSPGATGPILSSLLSGQHAICNDIEHDPHPLPWKSEALRRGYRSSAAFPLNVDGETVGIFSLYADQPQFFVGDELLLLDEMAMDISFALEVNRHEDERRKGEEELRRRTAFLEAMVESALDCVLVIDSQGKKILQNQRIIDVLKIPPAIAADPDFFPQLEYVKSVMKNPEQFVEKARYLITHVDEIIRDEVELADGTILDRYSAPVKDKAQKYYGRIWTLRDITERRQLEAQFRQAQKMEAVGQLTGGIAHDFNNLLTVILGCSEFIAEEVKENARLHKMAEMIVGAANRGSDLTHRMLAYARRQTLQSRPVDINQLLTGMESFLRRTLSADIELHLIQSETRCEATVDPAQLENALLNLCVNARDAMPEGGKLIIEASCAALDTDYAAQNADVAAGEYVLLAVSDTGCGISQENLSRVFDPFFTTKEVGKGTGLGLSMVYGFVKQSQGHVQVYSEPGQGTSVKLYLPKSSEKSEPISPGSVSITELRGSETILLVEDNESVREFAKLQLTSLGYVVLDAANGLDALEILNRNKDVNLLFTDIVMPGGLNGRELARRACEINPGLKVLYCSGYAEQATLRRGLLEKDMQLLNKPYSRLGLATRIRGVLTES
jgi:signal transduction histidine kinase/CheY-like chemotaxis protein